MDPARHGIAKMCVFVLQTLSVEPGFGKHMNEKIKGYSISPARQRLPDLSDSFSSFGDLLIMVGPSHMNQSRRTGVLLTKNKVHLSSYEHQ